MTCAAGCKVFLRELTYLIRMHRYVLLLNRQTQMPALMWGFDNLSLAIHAPRSRFGPRHSIPPKVPSMEPTKDTVRILLGDPNVMRVC